jgi:hypothetical protein
MNWEQWLCPDPLCTDRTWMVRRDFATCDVWSVARHKEDLPFTIAATAPVCPLCGTALLTLIELEGGLERRVGVETGPVFDFVRSLS